MKLGMQVGLDPSHIVLHGDPIPHRKGAHTPIFGPCLLWPNGWLHQDTTWHGGRPRPRQHCVRWGPSSLPPKGARSPIFGPCLLWPNGRPSLLLLSSFSRVVDKWNELSEDLVTCTSVDSFKNRLDCFMHKRGLYKFIKGCLPRI